MATQQINGFGVTSNSTRNNGGIVSSLGGTLTGPVNTFQIRSYNNLGAFASTIIDGLDTDTALVSGDFATLNDKPIAFKLTDEIASVPTEALSTTANDTDNARSINVQLVNNGGVLSDGVRTVKTTTAIREGRFDIYSGKFDPGYPIMDADEFAGADSVSGDLAAKVSRANPGTLVYKTTKSTPTSQNYEKKTG